MILDSATPLRRQNGQGIGRKQDYVIVRDQPWAMARRYRNWSGYVTVYGFRCDEIAVCILIHLLH
jgi:hypothetical protein